MGTKRLFMILEISGWVKDSASIFLQNVHQSAWKLIKIFFPSTFASAIPPLIGLPLDPFGLGRKGRK